MPPGESHETWVPEGLVRWLLGAALAASAAPRPGSEVAGCNTCSRRTEVFLKEHDLLHQLQRDFEVWASLGMKGTPAFSRVGVGAGVQNHSPHPAYCRVFAQGA